VSDDYLDGDSPEFKARCLMCPLADCNLTGSENMERCIMRNGLNFETPRRAYMKHKTVEIKPVSKLQYLKTGTDWRANNANT